MEGGESEEALKERAGGNVKRGEVLGKENVKKYQKLIAKGHGKKWYVTER